jgi:predicted 3-demethylubiquinone-9 3-methyltransferase (glyoxalase superfamily)
MQKIVPFIWFGHEFGLSTANSHAIVCDSQDEIDPYWTALAADPAGGNCGWIEDRFGVTWQVVPGRMIDMLHDPDPARVARVTEAFMAMRKLNLAELERAYAG